MKIIYVTGFEMNRKRATGIHVFWLATVVYVMLPELNTGSGMYRKIQYGMVISLMLVHQL